MVYETLWTRMLALVFGNTTYAVSTILAAFMAGLALGSWYLGKHIDKHNLRKEKLLNLYAFLMVGAGVYCFLTPWLFDFIKFININIPFNRYALVSAEGASVYRLSTLAFATTFFMSFIIFLIPTTFIGGALPVLARWFSVKNKRFGFEKFGQKVALLYTVDVWGAVAGTFLCGYFLIPKLGVKETLYLASLLNVAIGLMAFYISGGEKSSIEAKTKKKQKKLLKQLVFKPLEKSRRLAILWAIGISGFTALAYEVLWTRALSLILGSSTYAFTTILCAFLAGLALGSMIYAAYIKKKQPKDWLAAFAFIQAAIGIIVLILTPFFQAMPFLFLEMFKALGGNFAAVQFIQIVISFALIIPPAVFFGISFPLAIDIYKEGNAGTSVGDIYFANTVGAVLGSLLSGFFLIKWMGVQKSIFLISSINIFLAVLLINFKRSEKQTQKIAVSGMLLLFLIAYFVFIPKWDKHIFVSGIYHYARDYLKESSFFPKEEKKVWKRRIEKKKMLFYEEGANFTVAVQKHPNGIISLSINGKTDASSNFRGDMVTQLLTAHLPLLFHPSPKDVLVVGLASGISLGGVTKWKNLKSIDCAEIEPAMIETSHYFDEWNNKPLEDKRVRLIIDDARNYLLTAKKKYDVIISEPSNPWILGCSPLFTREYYELVKSRLKKGGLFCGWMQIYNMGPKDYLMIMKTINSVFKNVSVWHASGGDTLIIASEEKVNVHYKRLKGRFAHVKDDLSKIHLKDTLSLLAQFIMSEKNISRLAKGIKLNTDNHPLIEFLAARNMYNIDITLGTYELLSQNVETPLEYLNGFDDYIALIKRYFSKGNYRQAEEIFSRNFPQKNTARGHNLAGFIYLQKKNYNLAEKMFKKAIAKNKKFIDAYINLGDVYLKKGEYKKAIDMANRALHVKPKYPAAFNFKGVVYTRTGKFTAALEEFKKAKRSDPTFVMAYINMAEVYVNMNIPPAALFTLKDAIEQNPNDARLYFYLGETLLKMGDFKQGSAMLFKSVYLKPEYKDVALKLLLDYQKNRKGKTYKDAL